MDSVACEHVDLDTGELNCTTLAEDAAAHFDLYTGHSYDPQEWLFDLAYDIAEAEDKNDHRNRD